MAFLFALIAAFFFLGVDPAAADPITAIVTAIAGALKVGALGAAIIKGLIYVGLSVGVSLLQKALAKKPENTTQDRGIDLQIKMGDDTPISFPVGDYAVGGKRKFIGVWGEDGKTPNAYISDVVELSNLPLFSLNGIWADDQKLTFGDTAHPELGLPVLEYRAGGNDYMWVKFYNGNQNVGDSFLTSRFQSAENYWNNTFVGNGTAYAIITCRFNDDLYSGFPTFTFEPSSIGLYDPRKDSTNGGVGTHRWGNRATYEPSNNPIVIAYNIIRGIYYNDEWVFGGRNLAAFRLPASNWIAAMNAADLSVVTTEGTEKAFRAGYEIRGDMAPIDVVNEILKGCNARIAEVGGVFKVLVGSPGAAVFSFTDDDIIVTKEQSLDPFPNIDTTINGLEANYPEPLEKWASKDAPARYTPELELEDGGRRLTASINFVSVPYKNQVQRLMLAMLQDYRRFRVHQIYLSPEAYPLEPNDVIAWTSARNGYVDKKFVIVEIESDASFNQLLTIKEVDPSDYDWNTSFELPTDFGWVGPILPPPHPMYGWTVEPAILKDSAGNDRRPSIRVSCDPDQDDVANVHVQARLASTGTIVFDSDATVYEPPYSWILHGDFHANDIYEVRGRFIHKSDQPNGEWSEWLSVTTPNVLLTNLDVYVDIDTQEIIDFVEDATEWIRDGVRQTILESQRTARKILDLDFGAYTDRQRLRTELTSTTQGITASYTQDIAVATGPTSALGLRLETIETTIPNLATSSAVDLLTSRVDIIDGEVNANAEAITSLSAGTVSGDTATANFRMAVSAGPAGYSSRIGFEARTGGAGDWRSAQLFIDVPASSASPSRLVMNADQIVMTNGTDYRRPFVMQGGVLYLDDVRVNTLSALSSTLGSVNIENAVVGTLKLGDDNLLPGSIARIQNVTTSANNAPGTLSVTLTMNHGTRIQSSNPVLVRLEYLATGKINPSGLSLVGPYYIRDVTAGANIIIYESHPNTATNSNFFQDFTAFRTYSVPVNRETSVFRLDLRSEGIVNWSNIEFSGISFRNNS